MKGRCPRLNRARIINHKKVKRGLQEVQRLAAEAADCPDAARRHVLIQSLFENHGPRDKQQSAHTGAKPHMTASNFRRPLPNSFTVQSGLEQAWLPISRQVPNRVEPVGSPASIFWHRPTISPVRIYIFGFGRTNLIRLDNQNLRVMAQPK